MSIQSALAFFHAVRQRPDLQEQLARPGPALRMADLVDLAAQEGLACSATELESAFRHDWTMRWIRQTQLAPPGEAR